MSKHEALTKRTRKLTEINATLQNQNLHTELHSVAQQIRESARKFKPKNARISRPVSPFGQGWGIWCVTEFEKPPFFTPFYARCFSTAIEEQVSYGGKVVGESAMVREEDIGNEVRHKYYVSVENVSVSNFNRKLQENELSSVLTQNVLIQSFHLSAHTYRFCLEGKELTVPLECTHWVSDFGPGYIHGC